jgi:hypothetical protein
MRVDPDVSTITYLPDAAAAAQEKCSGEVLRRTRCGL